MVRWDREALPRYQYRVGAQGKYDLVEATGSGPMNSGPMDCPVASGVEPLPQRSPEVLNPMLWSQSAVYVPLQAAMPYTWSYQVVWILGVLPNTPWSSEPGGYDEDWLDQEAAVNERLGSAPERHVPRRCPICLCVAKDAVEHACGQIYCAECWFKLPERRRCPTCRGDGQEVRGSARRQCIQWLSLIATGFLRF